MLLVALMGDKLVFRNQNERQMEPQRGQNGAKIAPKRLQNRIQQIIGFFKRFFMIFE